MNQHNNKIMMLCVKDDKDRTIRNNIMGKHNSCRGRSSPKLSVPEEGTELDSNG